MKTNYSKTGKSFLLFVFLFISSATFAAKDLKTARSEFQKCFDVTESVYFMADNRYGSIVINYGDNKEVIIDVVIDSKAVNQNLAQERLDETKVDVKREGDKISVITTVPNKNFTNKKSELTIDLNITLPRTMNAELKQKFGKILMGANNEANYKIELKYGLLEAGNFASTLKLECAYSKIKLGNIEALTMDLAYCDDVNIGNLRNGRVESKYSNMLIRNVADITIDNKYGNITIDQLGNALYLDNLSYSTMKVKNVAINFRQILLKARYSNIDIWLPENASYKFNSDNIRYSKCYFADKINLTSMKMRDDVYEYVAVNGGGSGKITFSDSSYSNLSIK